MAGTRSGRSRTSTFSSFTARKILSETDPGFGHNERSSVPRPTTAKDIAVIAGTIVSGLEEPKSMRTRTISLLQGWAARTAPEQANHFWFNPDNRASYGFYNYLHPLGSQIVTHQALADLLTKHPVEELGTEFDPKRHALVKIASTALVQAAGSVELVRAFEQPVPHGLEVVTSSDFRWVEEAVPFPHRLADYDPEVLRQYESSLTERQHVRRR